MFKIDKRTHTPLPSEVMSECRTRTEINADFTLTMENKNDLRPSPTNANTKLADSDGLPLFDGGMDVDDPSTNV